MKLTIAIPTIIGREQQFERLKAHLEKQQRPRGKGIPRSFEIISLCDNKELSIGAKRQKLLMQAKGTYIVMIDDDDWVPDNYIETIMPLLTRVDCIGYLEDCVINGRKENSIFSLAFTQWGDKVAGYDHVRTPFYKSPMLTKLARQVGYEDVRWGEDHLFAKAIYPFLKTETFVNSVMYFYSPVFDNSFKERYGIK